MIEVGDTLILLLCGGDKASQQKDVGKADQLADEWRTDRDEQEASDDQE